MFAHKIKTIGQIREIGHDMVYLLIALLFIVASSVYLLAFDSVLYSIYAHWLGLLLFLVIDVALVFLAWYTNNRLVRLILGVVTTLWVLAMLLDMVPNLAYYGASSVGYQYLLGFGAAGTYSYFGTSLAFVLLFIASIMESILAFKIYYKN